MPAYNLPFDLLALILLCATAVAIGIVFTARWHATITGDHELSGVQKIHVGSTPRIGALAIIAGLLVARVILPSDAVSINFLSGLLLCSVPVVLLGLCEDLTKKISPWMRLLAAILSACAGIAVFDLVLPRFGIFFLEEIASNFYFAAAVTILLVAGFTNAINIVDGLNGLAAGLVLLMLSATFFVARGLGDVPLANTCLILGCCVLGFLLLNFPRGSIFMGDGGAYLLGFMMVGVWIFLLQRQPGVSPWFMVAVGFYPTMETLFSIYRRRFHGAPSRRGAMAPDRLHMHSLVYRRWALPLVRSWGIKAAWAPNALASVAILCWMAPPALLAVWRPTSNSWNAMLVVISAVVYLLIFERFVGFKKVRWGARRMRSKG